MPIRVILTLFLTFLAAGAWAGNTIGLAHTAAAQECVEGEGGSVNDTALFYSYAAETLDLTVSVPLGPGSCDGMVMMEDRDRAIDFSVEKRYGLQSVYVLLDASSGGTDAFGVGFEPVLGAGAGFNVGPVSVEAALDFFSLTDIDHVLHDYYGDHPFMDDLAVYAEASFSLPFSTSLSLGGKCGLGDIDFGACKYTGSLGWSRDLTRGLVLGLSVDVVRYPDAEGMAMYDLFDGETRVSGTASLAYRF